MERGDTAAPLIFLSSMTLEDVQEEEEGEGRGLTDSNMLIWNVADHSFKRQNRRSARLVDVLKRGGREGISKSAAGFLNGHW